MRLFGNRRYGRYRSGRISPLAVIGICVAAAILVTVIIGNMLKLWLDEETYNHLMSGEETTTNDPSNDTPSYLRDIHADAFVFGKSSESVWEVFFEASVSINSPTGEVNYVSDVVNYFGFPSANQTPLFDGISDLSAVAVYISGVFYPQALTQDGADLLYAATARECALMREFLHAGGSEILLCGISWETVDTTALLSYVEQVKKTTENAPVGIAIPLEVARSEGGWELLGRLSEACDFFALDLTAADPSVPVETLLTDARYYLEQYDMRVLADEEQEELILAVYAYPDVQIITHYAKSLPPAEEEMAE
jgi:hypothetical protein